MRQVDVAVIGAGPTGLFAAYYAGFRGLTVAVVDTLPEPGGQITALYPEKDIFDVAGLPALHLADGSDLGCGAVIVTGGLGSFTPRPLPAAQGYAGAGIVYFVPQPADLAGHDVLIVGG